MGAKIPSRTGLEAVPQSQYYKSRFFKRDISDTGYTLLRSTDALLYYSICLSYVDGKIGHEMKQSLDSRQS